METSEVQPDSEDGGLLEALPDAALRVSPSGAILYANSSATELFGQTRRQLASLDSYYDLFASSAGDANPPPETRIGQQVQYRARLEAPPGASTWVAVTERPIPGQSGPNDRLILVEQNDDKEPHSTRLRRREKLLNRVTDITLEHQTSFEQKTKKILRLGCRELDLPVGILLRKKGELLSVVEIHDPNDCLPLDRGDEVPLEDTYCKQTISAEQGYCSEHCAGRTQWRDDSAYQQLRLESYIGQTVTVRDRLYGTLCFASPQPKQKPFNDSNRNTVDLLSRWFAYEIDRQGTEHELQRFFNLSIDFLCIANFDGYFEHVNPVFYKTLGYDGETLLSHPFIEFVHPEDREATASALERLNEGQMVVNFENRYRAVDGSYRWLSWRAVPSAYQDRIYAVARDLTEKKEVEQMKDEVISIVSHELRTPLTSIKGALDLGMELHGDELDKELAEFIQIAQESTYRLERLVNDILAIEKLRAEELALELECFSPATIVREVAGQMTVASQNQNVRLETRIEAPDVRVEADRDRLYQVLNNLVSNAVKFSPENATVFLELDQPDSDRVEIRIADQGPGIPEGFQDELFERFTQADSSDSRHIEGSGLGLAIGSSLTERMGGELDFETTEGVGTTFFVRLPVADPSDAADD